MSGVMRIAPRMPVEITRTAVSGRRAAELLGNAHGNRSRDAFRRNGATVPAERIEQLREPRCADDADTRADHPSPRRWLAIAGGSARDGG